MAGSTIRKHITLDKIVDAINAAVAYSITAVAKKAMVRHSDIIYHFNEIFVLRKYYHSQHNLVMEHIEKEKREKVEHVLRNSRKNPQYTELYKPTGMTHREFFKQVHSRKSLENLFNGLYDGSRKMSLKTITKIKNLINKKPNTPMYKLKKGLNAYAYINQSQELKEEYVKRNGKIRAPGWPWHSA